MVSLRYFILIKNKSYEISKKNSYDLRHFEMQVEGLVKFREGDFKNTGTVFFQLWE